MAKLVGTVYSIAVISAGANSSAIEFVLTVSTGTSRSFQIIPLRSSVPPKSYHVEQHAFCAFAALLTQAYASKTPVLITAVDNVVDIKGTPFVTSVGMPASAFPAPKRQRAASPKRKAR